MNPLSDDASTPVAMVGVEAVQLESTSPPIRSKLSRYKAPSLSNMSFQNKQKVINDMFANRQSPSKPLPVKETMHTSISEIESQDTSQSRRRRHRIPVPGLHPESDHYDSATTSPNQMKTQKGSPIMRNLECDTEKDDHIASIPCNPKIVQEFPSEQSQASPNVLMGPRKVGLMKQSNSDRTDSSQLLASGQSIRIRLPAPVASQAPVTTPCIVTSTPPSPFPPSTITASIISALNNDRRLMHQTVTSFEHCLHHALDVNTVLLSRLTKQSPLPMTAITAPNITIPSSSTRITPCNLNRELGDTHKSNMKQTMQYAQGVQKLTDLITTIRSNTDRHAKVMELAVAALTLEQEQKTAMEFQSLITLLNMTHNPFDPS